jgi:spermidine synthase
MAKARDRWLLGAFVLSGAAALGYEILWTRLLALALGSETLGVLGVLAGFFGGMALGAVVLHDRARRSPDPVGLFVRLELTAAAFAVVSPWWLHVLAQRLPAALGPMVGDNTTGASLELSIGVAAVVLLPGTFCLGATLPALVEARRRACPDDPDGRGLGRLYAANTTGAVLGVLVTVHALLPLGGMVGGAAILAALGVGAAMVARRFATTIAGTGPSMQEPAPLHEVDASKDPDPDVTREPLVLLMLMAGTGLAGVGLEVVAVQILSQVLENTIYTFAHVLAVYLAGTALGAAIYTRYAARAVRGRPATVAAVLLVAHGAAVVWSAILLGAAPGVIDAIVGDGRSATTEMLAEVVAAALVLGPPTLLMGALFSHVAGLIAPRGIGLAYAVNTLGGAIAPFAFGVWAIDALGYRDALFAVAYAYLALFGAFTRARRFRRRSMLAGILGVVLLTSLAPNSLVLVELDDDWTEVETRQTLLGTVVVSEMRPNGQLPAGTPLRRLQVGKHFRMGGKLAFGERRMGEIPLLLHPRPRRALFLGVGTGATLSAVRHHPSLEHIDAVELVPAVLDMLHHFRDINGDVEHDERVRLHAADARRFVAASTGRYDVIVADLFHPGQDGAGNLYAIEHFENVRQRLAPGGVFGQWLPLYQLDARTLRTICRTFLEVFGETHVLLGVYNVVQPAIVLVGHVPEQAGDELVVDVDVLARRLEAPIYRELLIDPHDLLGAYFLDGPGLAEHVGPGAINSDLMPRVTTDAPRTAYEESTTRGRDNLLALLEARRPLPENLLVAADAATLAPFRDDVAAHAEALGHYLHGESVRLDIPDRIPGLEAATEHYLAAYHAAPRFRPARGMLLQTAGVTDELAERIFPAMLERTPDEPIVWRSYLGYLQRRGDSERLARALDEARARLGEPAAAPP